MPEQLKCLRRECLEENEEFLLDELDPIELCDILLEERAIEIMIHDKITETEERRQQAKDLLQVLQENKNECFHYFLHIIQSNEYKDICNQLKNPSASEAVGKGMFNFRININLGFSLFSITILKHSSFYVKSFFKNHFLKPFLPRTIDYDIHVLWK